MSKQPEIDSDLGEALHDREEEFTQKIVELIKEAVRARHPALRDAHPKAHGSKPRLKSTKIWHRN